MRFLEWIEETATPADAPSAIPHLPPMELTAGPSRAWRGLLELSERRLSAPRPYLSAEAAEAIFGWNRERGADPSWQSAWKSVVQGRGVAVVTGQQPALLGGPLYSIYKLLTAVSLALRLEQELGCAALAVFWTVGDDTDFGEVAATWIPALDGRVVKVRDAELPAGAHLIGRLPVRRQQVAWEEAQPLIDGFAGRLQVAACLERALQAGRTWSEFQAALFHQLLPGLPFLIVDGAHPEVVAAQTPLLRRAAAEWPLEELLREGAQGAREIGYDPALDPDLGGRAFFRIEENRRVPVGTAETGGAALGPNVVLRPVVQDALLPNVATICGPAESRYRAQLGPVYQRAGIPEPLRVPRLCGILSPPLPGFAVSDRSAYRRAAVETDSFLSELLEAEMPARLLAQVERGRDSVRQELDAMRGPLMEFDPSLVQILESSGGKIDFQVERLIDGVRGKARHRLLRREPRLARWKEFVRPRDEGQERSLSLLTPFLSDGAEAAGILLEAARAHLSRVLERGLPSAAALFLLEGMRPAPDRPDEASGD